MIAETGDLTEVIKIIEPGVGDVDEYGDLVSTEKVIYPRLFAMLRSKNANDVEKNLSSLSTSAQFVIRHRLSNEQKITTDMQVVHRNEIYKIDDFNIDTQFKKFDVIICHKSP